MAPPKIQISVQGGGAKFASLLPAVDAALQAHAHGIVTITRASGSSAGAIAAALIACKADFAKLDHLLDDNRLQVLIADLNKRIPEIMPEGKSVRIFKLWRLLRHVVLGGPVEDIQKLRALLEYLFLHLCGFVPETFERIRNKTGIFLRVTNSDIINQTGRVVEEGPVLDAILDSCALPFFYRNYKDLSSNGVVDGGICDNLPVQHLLDDKKKFGEIFAICLNGVPATGSGHPIPGNIFSYAWSIWSAVSNDAIKRTKATLNTAHIIDLYSDVSLTDFKSAIDQVKIREKYEITRDRVLAKFMDYAKLQSYGEVSEKITVSGHIDATEMMSALFNIYKQHFDTRSYRIIRASYVVRADCLDKFSGIKSRRADQVTRETIVELPQDGSSLSCIRNFIDVDSNGSCSTTRWSVEYTKSKRTVRPIIIPADNPETSVAGSIDCLLFFEHPLQGNEEDGYEIRISSHYAKSDAMLPLESLGSDFISSQNGHDIPVEQLDLVLCVPKAIGQLAVAWDPALSSAQKGTHITDPKALDDYRFLHGSDYNVFVFRAHSILPGEKVGARFTRVNV